MAEDTENKDKILDAMWRGDLTVKEESPEVEESQESEPEMTEDERKARQKAALEHLLSGLAFKERED